MVSAGIPGDGNVRIGPVSLPLGRQVRAGGGGPVAWATTEPVPDAGRVWAALSGQHAQSGLAPFLPSTGCSATSAPDRVSATFPASREAC
jgi:hypothetical protein